MRSINFPRILSLFVVVAIFSWFLPTAPRPAHAAVTDTCSTTIGDYTGDLILSTSGDTLTKDGTYYCNTVNIVAGATLTVGTTTGTLTLNANSITVNGTITADGKGFAGGANGTGGAAGTAGTGGAAAGSNNGTNGTAGGSGTAGVAGSGSFGGALGAVVTGGALGSGGAFGASGGTGGSLGTAGAAANNGADGGYAAVGANGDSTTDESLNKGSGGGGSSGGPGGGGGGGGGADNTATTGGAGGNAGAGGAGGNGGAGAAGGGTIKLISLNTILGSGTISAKGLAGAAGASGVAGSNGSAGTGTTAGTFGTGGAIGANGTAGGNGTTDGGGGGGGGGGGRNGGTSGDGAGGGVMLKSTYTNGIAFSGTIDTRGGNNKTAIGGTTKFFFACGKSSSTVTAGRTFESTIGSCPPPPPPPDTTPPVNPTVLVQDGAEKTSSQSVTLKLSVTDGNWVFASEDSKFVGVASRKYTGTPGFPMPMPFTLSSGDGVKTVYARFMDEAGNLSPVVSDGIVLETVPPGVPLQPPPSPPSPPLVGVTPESSSVVDGDLIRASNTIEVYVTKKVGATVVIRHIMNPRVFDVYPHLGGATAWSKVESVSSLGSAKKSSWIRGSDGKVWEMNDDGTRHHLQMTWGQFSARVAGGDSSLAANLVFEVNGAELALYNVSSAVLP